jgi:para-aminobenzoate synthetase / 4-amino-4-deoxychorismate lyase
VAPDPAYGVFDTLLVRAGEAVDLEAHVERLTRSVHELYDVPVDAPGLAERIVADSALLVTARVRTSYEPTTGAWEIEAAPIDEPGLDPRRVTVRRVPGGLGPHKWRDRRLVAGPGGADDVLLVDDTDGLLECGAANVFVVLDDECATPPLDGRILPGTVRVRVLAELRSAARPATERRVSLAELAAAAEVFTTSSIRGVQPVVACAGVGSWPVGPVTSWLRERLGGPPS